MKTIIAIRILFVLFLALGFANQHNTILKDSCLTKHELVSHPVTPGNFSSNGLSDTEYGDDIINEVPLKIGISEKIVQDAVSFFSPAPVLTDPTPCWQPPESLS